MKTTLILVRHGNSVTNVTNTFAGSLDAELNEIGCNQAKLTAEYLKNFKIDKIYSSDLKRAYNTAVPIAEFHNMEIEKNVGLRELFAGEWEGKTYSEIEKIYPYQYNLWMNDVGNCVPENGESLKDFFDRIKNTVFDIAEKNKGKTVCITTHATPIRALKTISEDMTVYDMNKTNWCPNASISIFEYEKGKLTLKEYGLVEHLGDNITVIPKCI